MDHVSPLAALLADPRYEVAPTAGVLDAAGAIPAGATVTVTAAARLLRLSVRIGVADAVRFARSHRRTAGALLRGGTHTPDELVRGLAATGADLAGLHVFTFNQIEPTVRWLSQARRTAA